MNRKFLLFVLGTLCLVAAALEGWEVWMIRKDHPIIPTLESEKKKEEEAQ